MIMIRAIKSDIGSRDRKEARQVALVRRKCCATVDDGGSHNAAPVAIPEGRHSHRQLACLWPVAVNRLTLPDPPCRIDFPECVSIFI